MNDAEIDALGARYMADPGAAAAVGAAKVDPNKSRRQSVMPLPPGALARRASMAVGKRPPGADLTGRAAKR